MNKKIIIALLSVLSLTTLIGCGESSDTSLNPSISVPEVSEEAKVALSSLKRASHDVSIVEEVSVKKPNDKLAIDIYSKYQFNYSFGYKDDERSFYSSQIVDSWDLDKETGRKVIGTERHKETIPAYYFKNIENGTALSERLSIDNKVIIEQLAYFNEKNHVNTPVIFDSEFKNPFDYITPYDIAKREDGSLTLINEKADFIATCYKTVGLNFIKDNTIKTNDNGQITSIEFIIEDLIGDSFVRSNTLTINYSNHGYELEHLKPFENNNPELQAAFDELDGKENFTYSKEYLTSAGKTQDYITGYFTHEQTYFRHHTEEGLEEPYKKGDEYDYKVILNEDGKSYTGYNYLLTGESEWNWGIIMVSSTSPYIMDTFNDIGPRLSMMNASIFKKIDNNTYEIEKPLLKVIGQYFDYQMLGVSSLVFQDNTTKCVVKLTDDGKIDVIETAYFFEQDEYKVNFHLSDIGTTEIPSWAL